MSTIAIRCVIGVTFNRECLLQILILEFVVYFSSRKYHLIVLIENIFYNSNIQSKNKKKILKNKAKSQLKTQTIKILWMRRIPIQKKVLNRKELYIYIFFISLLPTRICVHLLVGSVSCIAYSY